MLPLIRRWIAPTVVASTIAACADSSLTTGLNSTNSSANAHGSSVIGNRYFSFLAPIANAGDFAGTFDATLAPVVTVHSGGTLVATLSDVRLEAGEEQYVANWRTPRESGDYRISVSAAGTLLGYADVSLASRNADKSAFAPGSTIPVKFRIAEGATKISLAPIGPQGGTLASAGGNVSVVVPAGALASEVPVTAEPVPDAADPANRLIDGTAHEFGPDGTHFAQPVQLTLAYSEAAIPDGVSEKLLRLYTLIGGQWQLVPGSSVNAATNTVTGSVTHFSTYGVLPSSFTMVSAGEMHACALTDAGAAWCWGRNATNQLGAPSTDTCQLTLTTGGSCSSTAVEVQGGIVFTSIEAGRDHTCGLSSAGEIWCWGDNMYGQLGDGTRTASAAPVKVDGTEPFTALTAEFQNSCGVTVSGAVQCWGNNFRQQLGVSTALCVTSLIAPNGQPVAQPCSATPVTVPIPPAVQVDAGLTHACARTAGGDVYCWGWNVFGQSGTGDRTTTGNQSVAPTKVAGTGYSQVSAGAVHSCALAGGVAKCWGDDFGMGSLGDGLSAPHYNPAPVAGTFSFTSVDASNGNYIFAHSCGVTSTGLVACWGSNLDGQLGVQTAPETCSRFGRFVNECSRSPMLTNTTVSFTSVTTGLGFTCGFSTDGDAYCWGRNEFGQLGTGTFSPSVRTPTKVRTQ